MKILFILVGSVWTIGLAWYLWCLHGKINELEYEVKRLREDCESD